MPIFVGGTGRSGTSRLAQIIGEHPDVYHIPTETHFVIAGGGLEELVQRSTDGYAPISNSDAIQRFASFLNTRARGFAKDGLHFLDLTKIFGESRYDEWAARFLRDIAWYEFDYSGERRIVGRYFEDRREMIQLCRRYIDELFSAKAVESGKRTWCEKTPLNMLSIPFLWELFPDARIVHISRHPLQVVASFLDQPWAPNNILDVCNWLEPLYKKWIRLRHKHGQDNRLIDLRLEDLANDWPVQRARLFKGLGLPDAATTSTMDSKRVIHGRTVDADQESIVQDRLAFAIEALGYN